MSNRRILCFDIETMPVGFSEWDPEAEIVAICTYWVGEKEAPRYWLVRPENVKKTLKEFCGVYDQADLVVGQYIRKFDLPTINGALMMHGLPTLQEKLTQDTKDDWGKKRGVSASLESFLVYYQTMDRLVTVHGKIYKAHLGKAHWRLIYRALCSLRSDAWSQAQLNLLRSRCQGDVVATAKVFNKMAKLGHLRAPKMWRP
jgi:hypothetical protein